MSLAFTEGIRGSELAQYRAIDISCDDCGRTKRLRAAEIADIISQGTCSLFGLHNRLRCTLCYERGGLGKNISLIPIAKVR